MSDTPPPAGPHKSTVAFSMFMIALGGIAYLASGMESMTALIPAFIGVPILLCGLLAAKARKPALWAALVLSVLAFVAPLVRIIPTAMSGELSVGFALASQLILMALAAILSLVLMASIRRPA